MRARKAILFIQYHLASVSLIAISHVFVGPLNSCEFSVAFTHLVDVVILSRSQIPLLKCRMSQKQLKSAECM